MAYSGYTIHTVGNEKHNAVGSNKFEKITSYYFLEVEYTL